MATFPLFPIPSAAAKPDHPATARRLSSLIPIFLSLLAGQARADDKAVPPLFYWEMHPTLSTPVPASNDTATFHHILRNADGQAEPFWIRDQRFVGEKPLMRVATLLGIPGWTETGPATPLFPQVALDWNAVPQLAAIVFPCLSVLAGSVLVGQKSAGWRLSRTPDSPGHA